MRCKHKVIVQCSYMNQDYAQKADKVINHFRDEIKTIRTGRAQPSLIEDVDITVEAYGGAHMRLRDLSLINAPDATMLTVQPFDPSVLKDIERGLQQANLGMNPVVDQNQIRMSVPPLTGERREELVKKVKQLLEEAKIALRNVRGDVKNDLEAQQGISEDDIRREVDALQKQFEATVAELEAVASAKEQDLRTL